MTTPTATKKSECRAGDFRLDGAEFKLADGGDEKKPRFRVVANSGRPFRHSWWDNFAIDLSGLQIGRQDLPILRDHDSSKIVGYTEKLSVTDEGLVAEGYLTLSTEAGREVKAMLEDGVPLQASVYVPAESVERVKSGVSVQVNGHTLEGPGSVFRVARLREVTVTAVGADEQTSASKFSETLTYELSGVEDERGADVPEPKTPEPAAAPPITKASLAVSNPDLVDQFREEGAKFERERVAFIQANAAPGQEKLAAELIKDGVDKFDALKQLNQSLRDLQKNGRDRLSAETAPPVSEESDADPPMETYSLDPDGQARLSASQIDELGVPAQDDPDAEKLRQRAARRWVGDKKLQNEYSGFRQFFYREKAKLTRGQM